MSDFSELLADVESLRDQCDRTARAMLASDPDGRAYLAFTTVKRWLTDILEQYS